MLRCTGPWIPGFGLLVLTAATIAAQPPTAVPLAGEAFNPRAPWVATFGGAEADRIDRVVRAPGGGFFLAGTSFSFGAGGGDIWVAHVTDFGTSRWEQALGSGLSTGFGALQATPDGGCVLAGSRSASPGETSGWVIKLTESGAVAWEKIYDGPGNESFTALARSPRGYYVGGVVAEVAPGTRNDACVLELDLAGNVLWQKRFAGDLDESLRALSTTADGLIVTIDTPSSLEGSAGVLFHRPWILRLDGSGSVLWQRTYRYSDGDSFNDIVALEGGGFVAVGELVAAGFFRGDCWLVRFDDLGNVLWDRVVGDIDASYYDAGLEVRPTRDGGFAVAGATGTGGAGSDDLWLLRFDDHGVLQWSRTIGAAGFDGGASVALYPDGGLLVAGFAQYLRTPPGPGFNPVDGIALRTTARGELAPGCGLAGAAAVPGINVSGVPLQIDTPTGAPTDLQLVVSSGGSTVLPLHTGRFLCPPR